MINITALKNNNLNHISFSASCPKKLPQAVCTSTSHELTKAINEAHSSGYSFIGITVKNRKPIKGERALMANCDRILEVRLNGENGAKEVFNLYLKKISQAIEEALSSSEKSSS